MTGHTKNASKKVTQTEGARILGVTREHLNRVLRGHRESRSLRRRWEELIKHNGNN